MLFLSTLGYDGGFLYFHAAPEGRKIDIIKRNNRVVSSLISSMILSLRSKPAMGSEIRECYGSGTAEIVDDLEAKKERCN